MKTSEFQEYDFDQSWTTISFSEYGYDLYGNRVFDRDYRLYKDELRITTEYESTYDPMGNVTTFHVRHWNMEPYELYYEERADYNYKNENITYRIRRSTFEDNPERIREIFYTYNNQEKLIKIEWREVNVENNEYQRIEYYSPECGDEVRLSYVTKYLENGLLVSSDSTAYTRDVFCNRTLFSEYTFIAGPVPEFELTNEYRWDYVYDDQNLISEERKFSREIGEDWVFIEERSYEYDEQERIDQLLINNLEFQYETMFEYQYGINGQLIYEKQENYIDSMDQWITYHLYEAAYSPSNKILFMSDSWVWLEEYQDFQYSRLYTYEYDFNDYMIRLVDKTSEYKYPETGEKTEKEEISEYTNRCDGAPVVVDLISSGNFNERRQLLKTYWQKANCEEVNQATELTIFPNPASYYINVYNPENLGLSTIRIVDMMGRTIIEKDQNFSNYISIDLTGLRAGVYVITIDSPQGRSSQQFSKI